MKFKKALLGILIIPIFVLSFQSCKDDEGKTGKLLLPQKPNILLIIADDLGKDACVGYAPNAQKAPMPNIQKMIDEGITFDNFWVTPLCTPTRSSILTGKFPLRNNMLEVGNTLATSETSLHSYLNNNSSYASAIVGKWHLGKRANHPSNMGIPYYSGLLSGAVSDYNNWSWTHDGTTETSTDYTTTKFTDLAINWIAEQNDPWFLWLAYNAPHTPFHLPPSELHSSSQLSGTEADIRANPLPYYLAMIEAMDTEIGRLLNSMSEEERNNTIIIFIGDNGSPQTVAQAPYDNNKSKNSLYLGGVNTPMIISGAGVNKKNSRDSTFVQSTDLFSTIVELADIELKTYEDGQSIRSLIDGNIPIERSYLYSEIGGSNNAGHTIRNDSFHLIKYDDNNSLFFNLIDDEVEDQDLGEDPSDERAKANRLILEQELIKIRQ